MTEILSTKKDFEFYSGQSMSKTFREGDLLLKEKTSFPKIEPGDIIILNKPFPEIQRGKWVHRVIFKKDNFLITRGDNNPKNDDEPVSEESLIGRVTHYERNGKIHKVWNGRLGLMRAKVLHGRLLLIRVAKFFLRKPYRLAKKTGIVAKLWRPKIEKSYFETQDGPLLKYTHKGITVASCWLDSNRWWFRRPYDFVIDPKVKVEGKGKCSTDLT